MPGHKKVSIKICCARNLMPMDITGKSDPYVTVVIGDTLLFTSNKIKKSLDPEWNEQFSMAVEDSSTPLIFNVYDHDRVAENDFMGKANIDLDQFDYQGSQELVLPLYHANDSTLLKKLSKKENSTLGTLTVRVAVSPLDDEEFKSYSAVKTFMDTTQGSLDGGDPRKVSFISDKSNMSGVPTMTGMVRVVVVQASGLLPPQGKDEVTASCSVGLGNRKYKTKPVKSFNPKWKEAFTLPWYEGQDDFVELVLMESSGKDSGSQQKLGRSSIDLKLLEKEKTHNLWLPVKDRLPGQLSDLENSEKWLNVPNEGEIHVLATISGIPAGHQGELTKHVPQMSGVGLLTVDVVRAAGLNNKTSWMSKRNPYTVLQVGNSRLQTTAVEDTVEPYFGRTFHFDIEDVSECLEVTVFDENDEMAPFMGKVKIPLLNIGSGGEKWFRLKDEKSRKAAEGNQARILLGIKLEFERLKACQALFEPRSIKYDDPEMKREFEYAVFKKNAQRLKSVKDHLASIATKIQDIFEWKDPFKSSYALLTYCLVIWYIELWMFPLLPLIFMTYYLCKPSHRVHDVTENDSNDGKCDGCDADIAPEEETTTENVGFTDKIKELMQKAFWIQEMMGSAADKVERVQNTFNFRVPFISGIFYCILILAMVFLYFVPLRFLVLFAGLNKFRKGLMKEMDSPNKVISLVSRVPTDEELLDVEELPSVCEDSERLEMLRRAASKDSDVI